MSSASDDNLSASEGSEGWNDVEEAGDDESLSIISLLDDKVFPDAVSMVAHCREKHNFDFVATRDRLGLDFYGSIKLVNFVRSVNKSGKPLPEQIGEADIADDKYLMPVLADDALIVCLDDLPSTSTAAANDAPEAAQSSGSGETPAGKEAALQAQIDELTKQFSNYRLAVEQTLDKRWEANEDGPSSGSGKEEKDASEYYWESYANHDIHETMLKDTVRTDAYRDFIYNNKHLFAGKVVLDIGCGTGILSMFCAKAGAKQVFAIDKSAILDKARENIYHNGLADKITCLRGRVEDVTLPVDKVDVIVSEWMGYCLLFEAMLPSVLWARDRYLKPDGLLVPSHATLFVAPVSDPGYVAEHVAFWRDVYGFDMQPMQPELYKDARVLAMPGANVCGSPTPHAWDLYRCTERDLAFTMGWRSRISEDVDGGVDGFLLWFDNYFAAARGDEPELVTAAAGEWERSRSDGSVAFTTGPHAQETHWKQGFLLIKGDDKAAPVPAKAGQEIEGQLSFSTPENHARGLSIRVDWDGLPNAAKSQTWALS